MRKSQLVGLGFFAVLMIAVLAPASARAEVDAPPEPLTGDLGIDLDFRRDGRCYFSVDADLTMPTMGTFGAYSSSSNLPAAGPTIMASPIQPVSLEGDVSLEIASPAPGKFKFTASGWVVVPERPPELELAVATYKGNPELFNSQLLQMGKIGIDEIRRGLPPELADLQLEELEFTSLDLTDSKLSFDVTVTVSSQVFTREKLREKIDELGLDDETTQQMKEFVQEFFESLPLGINISFEASVGDEEFSLELDAEGLKKGKKVGTLSIALEVSEPRRYASFELVGKGYEEGEVTGQVNASFEASETLGVFSAEYNAEVLTRRGVLGRIGAKLEVSKEEERGDFYLNLYSPKASLTSEGHVDGQVLKIGADGWAELPRVKDEYVRGRLPIENLLLALAPTWAHVRAASYPAYPGEYPMLEEMMAELGAKLRSALAEVNVALTLKVPPDAELEGLPIGYQVTDSTYKWTGAAADEALVGVLMGRFEVVYRSGITVALEDLPPGVSEVIDLKPENFVVREVKITPKETVTVNVTVVYVDKPPECPDPKPLVYKYLKLETDEPEAMEKVEIEFKVEKSWIENDNIVRETVRLLRYQEGDWIPLPTSIVDKDDYYLYCVAETAGFSYFAIAGETAAPLVPPELLPPKPFPWQFVVIGIAIALVLVGIALYVKRKPGRKF